MLYYIITGMKFIRPFILLHAIVLLPLAGNILSPVLWLAGITFTGMIYGVDYRLRNPGDKLWLYRPVWMLMSTFVYTWLLIWAELQLKNSHGDRYVSYENMYLQIPILQIFQHTETTLKELLPIISKYVRQKLLYFRV